MGSPAGFEGARLAHALSDERPEAMRIWLFGGFRVSVGSCSVAPMLTIAVSVPALESSVVELSAENTSAPPVPFSHRGSPRG
jgi:hypothetical protein